MSALFTALLEGESKERLAEMVCDLRDEVQRLKADAGGFGEGKARMLAWLIFGDRLPASAKDEAVVRDATTWLLSLAAKLESQGWRLSLERIEGWSPSDADGGDQ